MGNHFLLQGTFPTQGSNRSLPHLLSEPPGKERGEQKAPTSLSAQVTSSSNLRNAPLASRSNFLPHNTLVFPTPHPYPRPGLRGCRGGVGTATNISPVIISLQSAPGDILPHTHLSVTPTHTTHFRGKRQNREKAVGYKACFHVVFNGVNRTSSSRTSSNAAPGIEIPFLADANPLRISQEVDMHFRAAGFRVRKPQNRLGKQQADRGGQLRPTLEGATELPLTLVSGGRSSRGQVAWRVSSGDCPEGRSASSVLSAMAAAPDRGRRTKGGKTPLGCRTFCSSDARRAGAL